jgi:3-phenylpropionate/trans-cinnamate dioxygenase ferredoxin subunit
MDPVTITLKRNGPYFIAAEDADRVRIVDHEGNLILPEPGKRIALCRCGGSLTKPFCDASHKTNGFCHDPTLDAVHPESIVKAP